MEIDAPALIVRELASRDQRIRRFLDGLILVGFRFAEVGDGHKIIDASRIVGVDALHDRARERGFVSPLLYRGLALVEGSEAGILEAVLFPRLGGGGMGSGHRDSEDEKAEFLHLCPLIQALTTRVP